ncbi:MAG: O-methyltransferase [Inquilinus sp.]|nr:O-methyltransferase [Inquilinus sp.]
MGDHKFESVERYIDDLFVPADPALDAALAAQSAGLPDIQVSAGQGKLLYLLARLCGARRILEIGTLAGYSAIWLGRALRVDGRLITLEVNAEHAAMARTNLDRAGLGGRVEVLVGTALETLPRLAAGVDAPFDLVFLDADKTGYVAYLDWALELTRPGGLILADNVVRGGTVLDAGADAAAQGARAFNAALAADPRVEAIVVQQVGSKGHDGLAIARMK